MMWYCNMQLLKTYEAILNADVKDGFCCNKLSAI